MRPGLTADLEQVAEAASRDQSDAAAAPLDEGVGTYGCPVGKAMYLFEVYIVLLSELLQAGDDGVCRVGRC